jgi:protein-disulfide isomerase
MARPLSRRELLQLGGVVAVGWSFAQVFQRAAPIGRDVGTNLTAGRLLLDRESPRADTAAADLTVVVFTDYQCPACKLAAPALEAAVRRNGRVRVIYKDWPIFGPVSDHAARVAVASARQGIYPGLHQHLMAERRSLGDGVLKADVEAAGGDWAVLQNDLAVHRKAIDQSIASNGADAFALGLEGTPAYLVGTILIVGGMDEAEFRAAFVEARKQRP